MKPGASGCNATQKNHHLLLDPTAQSRSRPSLEIAVDDVRCSHGSTSGALDPESLFYLRARGLDETQARHLLTLAFAGGFLERLPNDSLKTSWQQAVRRILPGME
jgi:Fe-S cluster assembly protein SufD